MDFLWDKITEWLKEMLIGGIVSNLSGMFDATNQKVAEISGQVGLSPQAWNGSIFSMIQNLSETVIVPIAGAILAFVMTLELIQLITDKNNLNDMDTWIFFKWAFKSAAAVLIVTNTWTIVMGVFDAAQSVVASASGLIIGDTSINISSVGVRLLPLCTAPESGGAYHVAGMDRCDCFNRSFLCPAVLPDGYYSDLREVNSLRSKVFGFRKYTKG